MVPFHVMAKPVGPVCNLECAYCYYVQKGSLFPDERDFRMAPGLLARFIRDYIAAQPGPTVDFAWQGGEPTLLGLDFFREVVRLQERHLPTGWTCSNALQTNGTLLDDGWGAFLHDHGFLVGISIDGPADLHDAYRVDKRGAATHAAVMRGLRVLQRHDVEYNVLCTVHQANAAHPLEVYRFLRDAQVPWVQFIPIVEALPGGGVSERSVRPEAYGTFLSAVFDEWVRHDVGRVFVQLFEESATVWAGLPAHLCVMRETCGRALVVEHNGDVYACDHFVLPGYRRGNLADQDLPAMVDSPAQIEFGQAKRDALPRVCRQCDVRFICNGGCPKDRFAVSADGESGLNYLCAGYRQFFHHAGPPLRRLATLWRQGTAPAAIMDEMARADAARWRQAGRNDPCPCGSGRKYKHCCLARTRP
jgi:uncharacterized protein